MRKKTKGATTIRCSGSKGTKKCCIHRRSGGPAIRCFKAKG